MRYVAFTQLLSVVSELIVELVASVSIHAGHHLFGSRWLQQAAQDAAATAAERDLQAENPGEEQAIPDVVV